MDKDLCYIQAVLVAFSAYAGVFFTSVITYYLYMFFVTGSHNRAVIGKWISIFVWFFSVVLTIIPFITESYGDSGAWCWIKIESQSFFRGYFIVLFFIPVSFVLIFNIYLVYFLVKEVRGNRAFESSRNRLVTKFVMYPIVMIVTIAPCFVARINEYYFEHPNYVMCLVSSVCWSLNGLFNSIVYGAFNVLWNRVFENDQASSFLSSRRSMDTIDL